jgi:uncharacterized protein (TIGR02246 family)
MGESIGVIEAWQRGMLAGDADAIAELYEDDAVLVIVSMSVVAEGKPAIKEAWANLLALGETKRIDIDDRVEVVDGDHAYAHQSGSMVTRFHGTDEDTTIPFRTTEIMHRGPDGVWRYIIDHA